MNEWRFYFPISISINKMLLNSQYLYVCIRVRGSMGDFDPVKKTRVTFCCFVVFSIRLPVEVALRN